MKKTRSKIRVHCIRKNKTYSIHELSELLRVHRNTVRQWMKKGMPRMDHQRPVLIYGEEAKAFLQAQKKLRKKSCDFDQIYCFRCREPKKTMGNMVDLEPRNHKTFTLVGLCSSCESPVRKIQSIKDFKNILITFDISKQQIERLSGCLSPSLKCYLEEKGKS